MSRGLGSMQRDILRACERQEPSQTNRKDYFDAAGNAYTDGEVYDVSWLRREVARLRGWWCEDENCRKDVSPMFRGRGPHRPHLQWGRATSGFNASFARAMRTLIERRALLPVTYVVPDVLHPDRWLEFGGLYPG